MARGSKEKRKGKRKEKAAGGRARIAIHTKSIPFVPSPPRPRATTSVPSPTPSLSFSLSLLLSPNFVANLRATKSAPFDFTLIRCRCRAIDEANLSLYAGQGPKGISFSAVRAIPSPAGLFQGNHFPSLSGSVLGTLYRSRASLRSPLFPLIPLVYCSLSSPLFSTMILSLVTQP